MGLFKYYSIDDNGYSLAGLRNQEIYFNVPSTFNDPFDATIAINNSTETLNEIFKDMPDFNTKLSRKDKNNILYLHLRNQTQLLGIFCMSKDYKQQLMWSHYTKNSQGFCVEYDENIIDFLDIPDGVVVKEIREVHYTNKRPCIKDNNICSESFFTKSKYWRYEKEIRIVMLANKLGVFPRTVHYKTNAIKQIYIGCNMTLKSFLELLFNLPCEMSNGRYISFMVLSDTNYNYRVVKLNTKEFGLLLKFAEYITDMNCMEDLQTRFRDFEIGNKYELYDACLQIRISDVVGIFKNVFCKYNFEKLDKFYLDQENVTRARYLATTFLKYCIKDIISRKKASNNH